MKTGIVIQARMESTRLPGKVLMRAADSPLLQILLTRLAPLAENCRVIVATTTNKTDDEIANLCTSLGVSVYRGSQEDVLDRYYQAAKQFGLETIVRITADCPLMDPAIVLEALTGFEKKPCDYASDTQKRSYPRGFDVEVFSFAALEKAYANAKQPEEREHVTPYLYRHPELFTITSIRPAKPSANYRLTVDTKEDFTLVEKILEALYPINHHFTYEDVLAFLKQHPDLVKINQHIQQKTL